jgi:polyhydroxybutyrate depolymerase
VARYRGGVSATDLPGGNQTIPLVHDGRDRPYLLHVPLQSVPAGGWPLVLELHGRGIDPIRFDRMTGFIAMADEAGFVVVAPSAVGEIWNDGRDQHAAEHGAPDDVRYLDAVLDDTLARLPIDERRVYAVGMSNGASMAGRFAGERSERIAALAQVAGTAPNVISDSRRRTRPVAVLQIHGSADPYWLYEGGDGGGLRKRVLLGAHKPTVGVDDWARFWVQANGASGNPDTVVVSEDTTARIWHGAGPSSDVVFYRIDGGGHTWPGGPPLPRLLFGRTSTSFNATRVIWDFFASHAR